MRSTEDHDDDTPDQPTAADATDAADAADPAEGDGLRSQMVERVALLLDEISRQGARGSRLKDLALATGIARPSVYRILGDLVRVGYVTKNADRTYTLGPSLFMLGLSAPSPIEDMSGLHKLAQQLADECGDVVYVGLRQLAGVHYLIRAEGAFPIRTHLVNVGDIKPFTSSYSGIALLSQMSEDEQRPHINRLTLDAPKDWTDKHRHQLQRRVRELIEQMQSQGYCAGPNVVMPGVAGIATCVPSRSRAPYISLSISAVEYRLDEERLAIVAPMLLKTARAMSACIL